MTQNKRKLKRHQDVGNQFDKEPAQTPHPFQEELSLSTGELVHMLQERQAELELHCNELLHAQKALQESHDRYQHLFEFAPIAYITLNKDDSIFEVNHTGSELLGYSQDYILKNKFTTFIRPESLEVFNLHKQRAFQTAQRQTDELGINRKGGTPFFARIESMVIHENNIAQLRLALTDITENKMAQIKEKQYIEDLLNLSQAAATLVEMHPEVDIYQTVAEQLQKLARNNVFIIVSSYDEQTNKFKARAFLGPAEKIKSLSKLMGQSPVGAEVSLTPEIVKKLRTGRLQEVSEAISPVSGTNISPAAIREVEKLFNIFHTYSMGFYWQGKLYGGVTILIAKDGEIRNPDIIETYIEQAAIALQRKQAQDALAKAKDELEIRVTERTADLTEVNASLNFEINIRRQVEEDLKRNLNFTASLLENVPNPIVVHDVDWTVSFINKALELLTDFSAKELIGTKPPFPWWPPGKDKEYKRFLGVFRKNKVSHFQRLFQKKNGENIWIELTATPIMSSEGEIISRISIWQDITGRKKAQAQLQAYQNELRSLASRLALTEQNERRNIANLIHDGVTQLLALSAVKMEVLMDSASGSTMATSLNEIYNLIQQAIEDTRTLTFELSPPSLYDLGLEVTLEELVERFGQNRGVSTSYDDDGHPKPLDDSTSILLFQAVRDILHGIGRYAQAHNIKVHTKKVDNTIHIIIKDDGKGFDIRALEGDLKQTISFDLFSIKERFRHIGGHVTIGSHPGKGSRFTLVAPLKGKLE